MSGFFEEVKRRKVYRVAAAYVIAAGFIIQIGSAVFPAWELPNWTFRLLVVLILAGFPIALIFAWIFDVTPSGIERTSRVVPQAMPKSHRRRNLILLAAAGLAMSVAAGFFVLPRASARKIDKSIAVLPFENLSADRENAYFADGIQDDILTNLSKIGDLKVISRTSVMSYRGKTQNVREIGKALGVSSILEGSVRRAGNKVRVNVQLIDATTDQHVWAEDYDGDLTDVFKIQTDLAKKIAVALQAKLSPTEKAQMARKPTENGEAYLAFLQAHKLFFDGLDDLEKLKQAEQLYDRALQLDLNFALACANFGLLEAWIYHSFDPTTVRLEKARSLTERALKLQPDLAEGHLTLGYSYYYGDLDYERALAEFAIAKEGLPNSAEVYLAIAAIERRQGKWEQSTRNFEKAASLDPKNAWVLQNLGLNYQATKNYEAAEKTFDRGIELAPTSLGLRALRAVLAMSWKGDLSLSKKMLATVPPGVDPEGMISWGHISTFIYERKFAEALAYLQKTPVLFFHLGDDSAPVPRAFVEGILNHFLNDKNKARAAFARALPELEKAVRDNPNNAPRHSRLGQVLCGLGRTEEAIREGKRALELLPETKDALEGPARTLDLAQIYAWTGENDAALKLLEHSLSTPAGITVPLLKIDPVWDPMRSDPRFQALIDKYSAKI